MNVNSSWSKQKLKFREWCELILKDMYSRGCTYAEIGEALGITRQRAEQLRKIYGIPVLSQEERTNLRIVVLTPKEIKKRRMYQGALSRALANSLPFEIEIEDVKTPDKCPVLGYLLNYENSMVDVNSPSLDRIVPHLGYIKGNVETISHRANTLKNDGQIDEFRCIVNYLQARVE